MLHLLAILFLVSGSSSALNFFSPLSFNLLFTPVKVPIKVSAPLTTLISLKALTIAKVAVLGALKSSIVRVKPYSEYTAKELYYKALKAYYKKSIEKYYGSENGNVLNDEWHENDIYTQHGKKHPHINLVLPKEIAAYYSSNSQKLTGHGKIHSGQYQSHVKPYRPHKVIQHYPGYDQKHLALASHLQNSEDHKQQEEHAHQQNEAPLPLQAPPLYHQQRPEKPSFHPIPYTMYEKQGNTFVPVALHKTETPDATDYAIATAFHHQNAITQDAFGPDLNPQASSTSVRNTFQSQQYPNVQQSSNYEMAHSTENNYQQQTRNPTSNLLSFPTRYNQNKFQPILTQTPHKTNVPRVNYPHINININYQPGTATQQRPYFHPNKLYSQSHAPAPIASMQPQPKNQQTYQPQPESAPNVVPAIYPTQQYNYSSQRVGNLQPQNVVTNRITPYHKNHDKPLKIHINGKGGPIFNSVVDYIYTVIEHYDSTVCMQRLLCELNSTMKKLGVNWKNMHVQYSVSGKSVQIKQFNQKVPKMSKKELFTSEQCLKDFGQCQTMPVEDILSKLIHVKFH